MTAPYGRRGPTRRRIFARTGTDQAHLLFFPVPKRRIHLIPARTRRDGAASPGRSPKVSPIDPPHEKKREKRAFRPSSPIRRLILQSRGDGSVTNCLSHGCSSGQSPGARDPGSAWALRENGRSGDRRRVATAGMAATAMPTTPTPATIRVASPEGG